MIVSPIAENIFGTFGAICWSVQLIPQIVKSFRTKSTTGLSEWLIFLWAMAGPVLGVYAISQNLNIPLILQSQLFTFFAMVSWIQCQYYGNKRPLLTCAVIFSTMLCVMAGFQIGLVYVVRASMKAGNFKPKQFFGVFSAILLSSGFIFQYYEIYKLKEVIGISMMFMLIDALGGISSTISLGFKETFDVFAGVSYSLVAALDISVLLAYLILNPITARKREKQAALASMVGATNGTDISMVSLSIQNTAPAELQDVIETGAKSNK